MFRLPPSIAKVQHRPLGGLSADLARQMGQVVDDGRVAVQLLGDAEAGERAQRVGSVLEGVKNSAKI